jgi:hypothetical protein
MGETQYCTGELEHRSGVFIRNTLMIQDLLSEAPWEGQIGVEDLRALTPLMYHLINPYGRFILDMTTRLPLRLAA